VALSLTTTTCDPAARHIDTATRTMKALRRADQDTHMMSRHLLGTAIVPLETRAVVVIHETKAVEATHETASADTGLAGTTMQKRNRTLRP
jgi:hypothetical protein